MEEKNYISIKDDIIFKSHAEVCNYFGYNYKNWRRAIAKYPFEDNAIIWFPKFFENEEWENKISNNGEIITEKKKTDNKERLEEFLSDHQNETSKRIVFAKKEEPTRRYYYQFQGVFKLNKNKSLLSGVAVYDRIDDKVKTK